jgi:hypothetical protein
MLGGQQSVGGVLSIWDRARLSVVILLPRVPTALPVAASRHVQFYLLFIQFPPAAGLCGVGSRLIDAKRQVRQRSGQDYCQELT